MSDLTPLTRQEIYLNSIAEGTDTGLTPLTREEWFLQKIIDNGSGGGGSGGVMYVTISYDATNDAYVADKTFTEIETAKNSGQVILLDNGIFIHQLDSFVESTLIAFAHIGFNFINDTYVLDKSLYIISNNNEVTFTEVVKNGL